MNRLTIISISIIVFGFLAGQTLAEENSNELAASEFFYGESIASQTPDMNTSETRETSQIELPLSDLAASDFFYGQPVLTQVESLKNENPVQRTEMAAPTIPLITPQIFYGYTDVIEAKAAKCSNC